VSRNMHRTSDSRENGGRKAAFFVPNFLILQLRGKDLNLRPLGYEPNELPLLHPAVQMSIISPNRASSTAQKLSWNLRRYSYVRKREKLRCRKPLFDQIRNSVLMHAQVEEESYSLWLRAACP